MSPFLEDPQTLKPGNTSLTPGLFSNSEIDGEIDTYLLILIYCYLHLIFIASYLNKGLGGIHKIKHRNILKQLKQSKINIYGHQVELLPCMLTQPRNRALNRLGTVTHVCSVYGHSFTYSQSWKITTLKSLSTEH